MNRYDISKKGDVGEYANGDYVLYADMIREMIPRPDAEAARKALDEVKRWAKNWQYDIDNRPGSDEAYENLCKAEAAMLKMMGVE